MREVSTPKKPGEYPAVLHKSAYAPIQITGSRTALIEELRQKYASAMENPSVYADRDEAIDELRPQLVELRKHMTRESFHTDVKREDWCKVQLVELIRQKITDLQRREEIEQAKQDELEEIWQTKEAEQLDKIANADDDIKFLEKELYRLRFMLHQHGQPPPPGPPQLLFVESEWFTGLASTVIFMNVVTIVVTTASPDTKGRFFWPNQAFMIFYIVELALKAILYREKLLCGKISIVWWNWLDLFIVCSGVLEMYIFPLILGHGGGGSAMSVFRVFRLARLFRLVALIKHQLQDLSWVEGHRFQEFMMIMIALNAVLMGFECDIPDFWGWFYIEQLLLAIFTFEVTVKLYLLQLKYFSHPEDWGWNWLDFIIVCVGVADMWVMPLYIIAASVISGGKMERPKGMGKIAMMLRMLRLTRMLRLVRLLKNIPPLFILIKGIIVAMEGMSWVVLLTFLLLYSLALPCVKLFGQGIIFGGDPPESVSEVFPDVGGSVFTLFSVMNGNLDVLDPLFEAMPSTRVVFAMYVVISTWSILSILTAVVSENMIKSTNEHRNEVEQEAAQKAKESHEEILRYLFSQADQDDDGVLTRAELETILNSQEKRHELMDAASLTDNDLQELFDYLSHTNDEGEEVISYDRFITSLLKEKEVVKERVVFRMEKRLDGIYHVLMDLKRSHVSFPIKGH